MAEGLTFPIIWAALWVAFVGYLIASRHLPNHLAVPVAAVKAAIPAVYFAWIFDGSWTFLDDRTYETQGADMLHLGYNPLNALFDPQGLEQLMVLAGGRHILYGWWNLLGQYLFGNHYFAPVFLNVLLTFVSGFVCVNILKELSFEERYRRWFLVLFLFHWELLAWSSLVNLKDVMIMTLTSTSLYLVVRLSKKFSVLTLIGLGLVLSIFAWIRFYIPSFILVAIAIWALFFWKDVRKFLLLPIAGLAFYFMFPWDSTDLPSLSISGLLSQFAMGFVRFALTPQPWSVEENYSFLYIPSLLHWVLFLPAAFAGVKLWKTSPQAKLLFIYLLTIIALYAVFPGEMGPRHRVQVTFIIAWMQFHFLWLAMHRIARRPAWPDSPGLPTREPL